MKKYIVSAVFITLGLIMWAVDVNDLRPLNNAPAETVRVNSSPVYDIFSLEPSFMSKFTNYSPQKASNLFIFSGNPENWADLSYLTIAK